MRLFAGIVIGLACCSASNVQADDTTRKKSAESVKLASAELAAPAVLEAEAAVETPGSSKATPPIPVKLEKVAHGGSSAKENGGGNVARFALAAPKPQTKEKPAGPSLIARIDLKAQRMHVTENDKVVGSWRISSGRSGYETPAGKFRPKWAVRMHYSRKYNNSPMPYSVFFNGGIATHGTSYTRRLGRPASHGCIRLRTSNARKFYQMVRRHGYKRTRIIVTGRAPTKRIVARRATSPRHARRSRNARRSNAFIVHRSRNKRYTLGQYEQRVKRYYNSRRMVFNGARLDVQ